MLGSTMFKKTVMEIFNEPDYEEERQNYDKRVKYEEKAFCSNSLPADLVEIFKTKKPVKICEQIINDAVDGQKKWTALSSQKKTITLHKIWMLLNSISGVLVKSKDDISLFADYFDFYCDIMPQTMEYSKWILQDIVLIVLSDNCPLFPVAATVPAALVAGCSIIVVAPETKQAFFLFLEAIFLNACLPGGVFKVVTAFDEIDASLVNKVSKVFFCGSYSLAQSFYKNTLVRSFSFFCPNQTAAFVLESADLNAAVDKIIAETWGKEDPFFAISNVIVQESIYQEFFHKLKYKMSQFISENKYSSKFNDEIISKKVQTMISKALSAGASVEEAAGCGKWHPTVIVSYQCQDIDQDVPVLKLLLCRTAKEGVALLNNCRHTLGTSVWSEIASQALEISSELNSPNVWINCHGAFHAGVPLQMSGFSGNCVLGGWDGAMEYMSSGLESSIEELEDIEPNHKEYLEGNGKEAVSAQQAFTTWQHNKNRRECLRQIADFLPDFSDIICHYAHCRHIVSLTDSRPSVEFSVLKNKIPIGVILLIINTKVDKNKIVSLITTALALGNVVIVALKQEDPLVQSIITGFNKFLPKNVLNLVIGVKYGIHLASDPNVQAVWLYCDTSISKKFLEAIGSHSVRNIKRFWIVPKVYHLISSPYHKYFQRECLKSKIVWLTKKDQFP